MTGVGFLLFVALGLAKVHFLECKDCYEDTQLRGLHTDHVFHSLKHPSVVGHMGNIQEFQENTLEGIKSLIEIEADGVHMHVRLTEDDQVILFQDDNLYRMTGEDFEVSLLPYSEILKMDLLKTIPYYKTSDGYNDVLKKYEYRSTSKIPLLSDALKLLKGKGLLVYIELLPSKISFNSLDRFLALRIAELTAQLVKKLGMEKEVLVVSRDATKLAGINFHAPGISFGWWADSTLYAPDVADVMKKKFFDFPRVYSLKANCLNKTGSTGFLFTKYLVSSGFISKVINASFIDFSIDIYNNGNYFQTSDDKSSIKEIIKANYGDKTTFGAFDIFSWNDTKPATIEEDRNFIKSVQNFGVTRILTNDVNRAKRALDEKTITFSKGNTVKTYSAFVMLCLLFGKTLVTLIYV